MESASLSQDSIRFELPVQVFRTIWVLWLRNMIYCLVLNSRTSTAVCLLFKVKMRNVIQLPLSPHVTYCPPLPLNPPPPLPSPPLPNSNHYNRSISSIRFVTHVSVSNFDLKLSTTTISHIFGSFSTPWSTITASPCIESLLAKSSLPERSTTKSCCWVWVCAQPFWRVCCR